MAGNEGTTPPVGEQNPPAGGNGGTTPPAPTSNDGGKPADPPATGNEQLGEAGKKALEAERDARKAADKKAADEAKRARDLEKELEQFRTASMSEQEKQVAEAEARGRATATQEFGKRLASAELRAQASAVGADTEQIEFWDLSRFVGDDGEPNTTAITEAIAKLPKKPFTPPPVTPPPSFDGGARPPAPVQTTPGMGTLRHAYEQSSRGKQ